jgi:hypothetical protein
LLAGVLALGPISGAVFNPAVGVLALFAPVHGKRKEKKKKRNVSIFNLGFSILSHSWVYFVAPFIAAALASLTFRFVSPKDHAPQEALMKGPVHHEEHHHSVKSFQQYRSGDETLN